MNDTLGTLRGILCPFLGKAHNERAHHSWTYSDVNHVQHRNPLPGFGSGSALLFRIKVGMALLSVPLLEGVFSNPFEDPNLTQRTAPDEVRVLASA